ncbi:hypothetical protein [Papillibacter cinnamivorans]|uniref:Uncharacterized protein n=1 Tax=Papillibacter cinnamivorans DSM 12816 TaxID=1122930 RepID=A0A1W2CA25_9FIRM|nr:hypothetical protein [Papillibacter cinnamivorans]SMC81834.1 hypothetical protein SAMN02745168_2645 [Papillibacter cinnamivorans DSM 12816]
MKRIKYACLEQTIHFQLKEDLVGHEEAAAAVREELEQFKQKLDRKRIQYKIIEETVQPDDSILLKLKRQFNDYSCGEYME